MKKILTCAFVAVAVMLAGCKKDDNNKPDDHATEFSGPSVVEVPYGGDVELDGLFTANGDGGEFVFTVTGQPEYSSQPETTGEWVAVDTDDIYEVEGSTLTSTAVRVPDALSSTTHVYARSVIQGKLKVELKVDGVVVDEDEFDIVQTDKPELQYEITYVDNENLTERTDGNMDLNIVVGEGVTLLGLFDISPIDFKFSDSRVVGMTSPDATYINPSSLSIRMDVINASETDATGEYVVAFFLSAKGADETDDAYNARKQAAYEEAVEAGSNRIYVNVEYVAPDAIVGIILNEDVIGTTSTASFWRNNANGRMIPYNFVLLKLFSGETRAYDNSSDNLRIMAGEFDQYLEGRTTEYTTGWWSHVALKQSFTDLDTDCPVGTPLQFKITVEGEGRFLEPDWTVTVNTERLAANPAA